MGASAIIPRTLQAQGLFLAVLIAILGFSASDLAQDRAQCTEPLVGLAPCLPYVHGDGKAPTPDCCSGLGQVLQKSFKCLCVLVKDRDEPSLGLKVNTTLALGLPSSCHTPVNISQCIDLLRLDPNSTDAKTFSGFEKSLEQRNSTQVPASGGGVTGQAQQTGVNIRSEGSRRKPVPVALKVVVGAALWTIADCCRLPFNSGSLCSFNLGLLLYVCM